MILKCIPILSSIHIARQFQLISRSSYFLSFLWLENIFFCVLLTSFVFLCGKYFFRALITFYWNYLYLHLTQYFLQNAIPLSNYRSFYSTLYQPKCCIRYTIDIDILLCSIPSSSLFFSIQLQGLYFISVDFLLFLDLINFHIFQCS